MFSVDPERVQAYRNRTYRLEPDGHLTEKQDAIDYVNLRGFVYLWPIKDVTLPSLWGAVAGDRPVADAHDDPGHITWGWKDELLGARCWYYAKILRRKATFVSLDTAPYFYALSENYGEPERDHEVQYEEGRLSWEAKTLYETLLREGPLDTVSLRRLARMTSKASNSPFNRAMELLQVDFKVLPVGVAQAGAWNYAFIYECVHRHYPTLPERARTLRQAQAREHLIRRYLQSVGAVRLRDIGLLFGWKHTDVEAALEALRRDGAILRGLRQGGPTDGAAAPSGEWVALPELVAG